MTTEAPVWVGFENSLKQRVEDGVEKVKKETPLLADLEINRYERVRQKRRLPPGYFVRALVRGRSYDVTSVGQFAPYEEKGVIRSAVDSLDDGFEYGVWFLPEDCGNPRMTGVLIIKSLHPAKPGEYSKNVDPLMKNGVSVDEVWDPVNPASSEGQIVGGLALIASAELLTRETPDRINAYIALLRP